MRQWQWHGSTGGEGKFQMEFCANFDLNPRMHPGGVESWVCSGISFGATAEINQYGIPGGISGL